MIQHVPRNKSEAAHRLKAPLPPPPRKWGRARGHPPRICSYIHFIFLLYVILNLPMIFLLICVWVLVLLCDVAWVHAQAPPSSLKVTTKFECAKDLCKQRSFVQPSRRHDSIDNPEKTENMEHLIKGCLHIHFKFYFLN